MALYGVDIEARNSCTEAERVFLNMLQVFVDSKIDMDNLVKRGHCYCDGGLWNGINHHFCCKCGDVQRAAPDNVEESV